ncbi:sec14p-like phosphatidylinositol transfer family protein [Tasmannia lanceolata]|uniref:sec14p-like phosphatidylinositol transfer family protein n=1 Tax=Tasmannia lanceolata TaxID=3420 RepID=UPI0040635D97
MTVEVVSKETQMEEVVAYQPEELIKGLEEKAETPKVVLVGDGEIKKSEEPKTGEEEKNKVSEVEPKTGEEKNKESEGEPKTAEPKTGEPKTGEPKTGEGKSKESEVLSPSPALEKSSSFKEESNFLSDLKENEKKALIELRAKVEEAIIENNLFKKEEESVQEGEEKEKPIEGVKEEEKPISENEKSVEGEKEKEKPNVEKEKSDAETEKFDVEKVKSDIETEKSDVEKSNVETEKSDAGKKESEESVKEKEKSDVTNEKPNVAIEGKIEEIDKDISLWAVPLLPSKGSESTDVMLLKFLRARDFKVDEAFEMLKNTLQWRKEFKMDTILDEDFGTHLSSVAFMNGLDREGHPVCYNIYGVFENNELYQKTFGTEEKREQFLRWRFQVMEKGIHNLNFKPGGVSSLLQITDLKNAPGPSKKELRFATKQAVGLLQDNYPEFVARNIFINVPFWYYAFNALVSPFLTQRTKSKFVFARPAKVTETLLKYIPAEDIPIHYGGMKRENDTEFNIGNGGVSECIVKSGSTETIEIPAPEVGMTLLWDLTVLGWEVNYKEEFVPTDEGSYTVIIQKGKKMGSQVEPVRNSFKNRESGKVILTIENSTYKKKKVLYRHKVKSSSS